jgi:hypothetical protein
MDLVKKTGKTVTSAASNVVQKSAGLFNNMYVNAALTLFLILYASLVRPQLPDFLMRLFDNPVFRLLFLAGIAFMATRNIQAALLVAVAFTVTMSLLQEQKIVEGFLFQQKLYDDQNQAPVL